MNRHSFLALLFLLAFALPSFCQTEEELAQKKIAKLKRKDQSHFVLKYTYFTPNVYLVDNFKDDLQIGKISGVANHSMLGFGLYIPLGRKFFLQPEVHFALRTNWDSASYENGIFKEFAYAFRHRQGTAMDIPLLFGMKWAPAKGFRAKAYLGPTFHFGWWDKEFQYPFSPYSITLGAGLDLLRFLSVDAGYLLLMDKMSYTGWSQWFVSVGLIM